MTCEPALYGHDKESSDTRVPQTDRGSGDKRAALRLIHLFGVGGKVWSKTPRRFSSDFPLCHLLSAALGANILYILYRMSE